MSGTRRHFIVGASAAAAASALPAAAKTIRHKPLDPVNPDLLFGTTSSIWNDAGLNTNTVYDTAQAIQVVAARGLAVVSDDGPLLAAIDEAIAANPDVVEKITGGKPAAAGVIVGAVMKATRGQADAARVRTLLFEKLGVIDE